MSTNGGSSRRKICSSESGIPRGSGRGDKTIHAGAGTGEYSDPGVVRVRKSAYGCAGPGDLHYLREGLLCGRRESCRRLFEEVGLD